MGLLLFLKNRWEKKRTFLCKYEFFSVSSQHHKSNEERLLQIQTLFSILSNLQFISKD